MIVGQSEVELDRILQLCNSSGNSRVTTVKAGRRATIIKWERLRHMWYAFPTLTIAGTLRKNALICHIARQADF